MATFMLAHSHAAAECPVAFASWKGFDSPLRHSRTSASCAIHDTAEIAHRIWWEVEAESPSAALAQLPPYLAERTQPIRVSEIGIP